MLCIISCVRAVLTSITSILPSQLTSFLLHLCSPPLLSLHRATLSVPPLLASTPPLPNFADTVSIDAVCTISCKTIVKTWANSTCIDRSPVTDGCLCQGLLLALTNALTNKCSTRSYQFCSISVHPPLLLPRSAIPCNLGAPPFPTLQMQCPSTPFAPYTGYSIVLTTTPHGQ